MKLTTRKTVYVCAVALAIVAGTAAHPLAQDPRDVHIRHNAGQGVVPVFEGWERNQDGSFDFVFGYLNRNYRQELAVPVGPSNNMQPDGPDRGQPAYFYPRENHFLFRVRVPKDWGSKELVWTIAVNGKTEVARATLQDVWEIDRKVEVSNLGVGGGTQASNDLIAKDQPPAVKVNPVPAARTGTPITLAAEVSDDGIPGPPKAARPRAAVEPTLQPPPGSLPSPVNVPMPETPRPPAGISLMWIVYRGPAGVVFEPSGFAPVKDKQSRTTATFSRPGTYTLRAISSDGLLRGWSEVTVSVEPSGTR